MNGIKSDVFGKLPDGSEVHVFTLTNKNGVEARIMNYGGTVLSLKVPDRKGELGDVVLGYDHLADYVKNSPYFGCLVGRYGNRIAKGRFTLNGKTYALAVNNGANALHGGLKGFDKVVWAATTKMTAQGPALGLNYVSKDGEEGYPGTLSVTAVYTLTDDNALSLEFTAVSDKDTVVNLTHHSYFNLAGNGDVLGHLVILHSDTFTPVDESLIPTGEIRPVMGTPFDFRKPTAIGLRIQGDDPQLKYGNGYDHNWIFNKAVGNLGLVATVTEPRTGRVMDVLTTEPAAQFYTGNYLNETMIGKAGWVYQPRAGFCIEPQHYPDSPNKPEFPTTVLKAGTTLMSTIIYRFSVRN